MRTQKEDTAFLAAALLDFVAVCGDVGGPRDISDLRSACLLRNQLHLSSFAAVRAAERRNWPALCCCFRFHSARHVRSSCDRRSGGGGGGGRGGVGLGTGLKSRRGVLVGGGLGGTRDTSARQCWHLMLPNLRQVDREPGVGAARMVGEVSKVVRGDTHVTHVALRPAEGGGRWRKIAHLVACNISTRRLCNLRQGAFSGVSAARRAGRAVKVTLLTAVWRSDPRKVAEDRGSWAGEVGNAGSIYAAALDTLTAT